MFFEFLNAVVTLDFNWLAWIVFANFHYLFMFAALLFIMMEGKMKSVAPAFFFFCVLAWAFVDFQNISGWAFFVGGFLGLSYVTRIAVLTFASDDPRLSKYFIPLNFIIVYALWASYNLFMVR
ncbi:MAG: hypothetical protein JW744_04995 [Candidatus Diapherotrites archaeon]|uniref:Uncharacterized protein n=1 Tax=Candidatus Iainarchaeum sp. TaxID=3101447 RepID=A0A938YVB5_9ARCH|nr:hypothetical protein [Candidatus Diapherotrites archaeon]